MADSTKDFRIASTDKAAPRSVADGFGGTIIAMADLDARPERVFQLLTTPEIERWWGHPEFYRSVNWKADLRVCGSWHVEAHFKDGAVVHGWGEFAEVEPPRKVVMTRRFDNHPMLGDRETTISYRCEPLPNGRTRLTVRDEGFIGRSGAAYGNAEHWERVLGWLDAYISGSG